MYLINRRNVLFLLIALLLVCASVLALFSGQFDLSFDTYWNAAFAYNENIQGEFIAREFRFPRLIVAIISGSALSVSGLLMQTLFRNPLAGPYVLGVNSGASLMVALFTMSGIPFFTQDIGTVSSALIGGLASGLAILFLSSRVKSGVSLLLVGLMIASFCSAIVSVLESLSSETGLKRFTMWTMGSIQHVSIDQIGLFVALIGLGLGLSLLVAKPLNVLLLGENAASLLGIRVTNIRFFIIGISILLASVVTAYCGPIAFVGLAIPNITRMLFKTQNHHVLLTGSALLGATFMVTVDCISLLVEPIAVIPINVFTSFIGAPFVLFIILKRL